MKYKLTWKDIIIANFFRLVILGFPIFIICTFLVTLLIQFFAGELGNYSFWSYIFGFFSIFTTLVVVYACVVFFVVALSFRTWKNTIVGEHEIIMDKEFFIWKSSRQEVKTKLDLLKDFTIKRKHLIIKFDGIRKSRIAKSWIQEGYDDFVSDMTKVLGKKK